jgi:hypothetical protein
MKKLISAFLAAILITTLVACNAPDEPVVISPREYEALNNEYLSDLLTGMGISQEWQNANELGPDLFVFYYASAALHNDENAADGWTDGFIPAAELEPMTQKRFGVAIELLHTSGYYNAERNAYELAGLGSVGESLITTAAISGNQLSIDYNISGPMDYVEARGTLLMEVSDGDIWGDNYKFLSNQLEWSAQHELLFPSALDDTDYRGVLMMESGGFSGTSSDGENYTYYNGEDINSIIAFYEKEALPALEAEGSADLTMHEDGWYWSGTYRAVRPL